VCPARNLFFSPAFLPLIDPSSTVRLGAVFQEGGRMDP